MATKRKIHCIIGLTIEELDEQIEQLKFKFGSIDRDEKLFIVKFMKLLKEYQDFMRKEQRKEEDQQRRAFTVMLEHIWSRNLDNIVV